MLLGRSGALRLPGRPPLPVLPQLLRRAGLGVPQHAKRPAEGLGPKPHSLLLGVNVPAFRT